MPLAAIFAVIILAGGRGGRLGGADKPGLIVGRSTLAASVVTAAIGAGARRVVVVGPPRPDLQPLSAMLACGLAVVQENPPAAGPVPALRCGLRAVREPWVGLLAADLPFLRAEHLRLLVTAAAPPPGGGQASALRNADPRAGDRPESRVSAGAVFVDGNGIPQWLAGCWQTGPLRAALASYSGTSLRGLLTPLRPVTAGWRTAEGEPPPWQDCDTPADLRLARDCHAQSGSDRPGGPARADRPPVNTQAGRSHP